MQAWVWIQALLPPFPCDLTAVALPAKSKGFSIVKQEYLLLEFQGTNSSVLPLSSKQTVGMMVIGNISLITEQLEMGLTSVAKWSY